MARSTSIGQRLHILYKRVDNEYSYVASQLATIYRIGHTSPDIAALVAHKEALENKLAALAYRLSLVDNTFRVTTRNDGKRLVIRETTTYLRRLHAYSPGKLSRIRSKIAIPAHPYTCMECGKALSFPQTLFDIDDRAYCVDHLPEYSKNSQGW